MNRSGADAIVGSGPLGPALLRALHWRTLSIDFCETVASRRRFYFANAGTNALSTSPRSRTIANVSSRASANRSNIRSISAS
jgi:hypothetical protein